MAITYDTTTGIGSGTGITGSQSWNHTAASSLVGGVGVVIVGGGVEETTGVTYGGGAMTRIATGVNASGESGSCSTWWIANDDAGWPGNGTRQVSITRSGSTAYIAQAFSVLVASGNSADPLSPTQNIGWDIGNSLSISTITTSLTIPNGVNVFLYGGLYSGENALSSITDNASLTRDNSADFGNFTGVINRRTAIYTGTGAALTTFAWTQSSDDGAWAVVAINENIAVTNRSGSFTANAVIKKTVTPTGLTADAVIKKTVTPTPATADAVVLRTQTGGAGYADAVIVVGATTVPGSFASDAVVLRAQTQPLALEAVVLKPVSDLSVALDAILLLNRGGSADADAIVMRAQDWTLAADAVVWGTQSGSLTANAVIVATASAALSADAVVQRGQSGSGSADAVIRRTQASIFATDAIVQRSQSTSLNADAYVAHWFAAEAWIAPEAQHFHADAVIMATLSSTLPVDAVVQRTTAASLAANGVVRRNQTGSFSATAVIKRNQSGSRTADAIRKRTFYFGSGPDPR